MPARHDPDQLWLLFRHKLIGVRFREVNFRLIKNISIPSVRRNCLLQAKKRPAQAGPGCNAQVNGNVDDGASCP
ncbi:protein of unknown function [Kyrpidia spormannii]|uniref:Uncharacterized protein n=2 Tax=Kyrpidia spormannii TaxID=2055160 RepID=A0ACA8ZC60_9BACL|nr:protein of unknown function [Kyrpidia spormannii]CAB3395045.1 protein of unknown function [Kyrpidia spormannii]